jgi:biopolymer transport protein ExbD
MIVPMIDVIFLLLLFFVLNTTFEAKARIQVQLPRPTDSRGRHDDPARNLVIQCEYVPGAAGEVAYRLGGDAPQPLATLADRLRAEHEAHPDVGVIVRADRRLAFSAVRRAMDLVAQQGFSHVKVAVLRDHGE